MRMSSTSSLGMPIREKTGLKKSESQAAAPLNLPLEPAELATLASDRDMGASELKALEATFAYLAEKKRLASIETLLRLSRLPRREPKTFDNFDFSRIQGRDASALAKLPALADLYARRNVAFIGPGGIGKTHLAQAYGRRDFKEAMRVLPNGRCVFKCDNNVVDHQVVNLLFEEGVTAQLTMTAFSDKNYRRTHIYGTKGEIETIGEFKIRVCVFGKEERVVDVAQMGFDLSGHGGGDIALIREFMEYCRGGGEIRSSAKVSLESHVMAFAAEKSRLKNGEVVKVEV